MLLPIHDVNPTTRIPVMTILIILANTLSWIGLQRAGTSNSLAGSLCSYGLISGEILGFISPGTVVPLGDGLGCELTGRNYASLLTHMFMHGGWLHILGNMWFLWVFGDNIEEALGPVRFLLFYLICGFAAAALQIISSPTSAIPMVGASGAIGGVLGAYARIFPNARVTCYLFILIFPIEICLPAFAMLGIWFIYQIVPALYAAGGGVAFWAHVGGFLAGMLIISRMRPTNSRPSWR